MGRQPVKDIALCFVGGMEISAEDVQVWGPDELVEESLCLSACCEKLLPMLQENEDRAWQMLIELIDIAIGEIPHMRYFGSLDVLEAPKEKPSIVLPQLPGKLKEKWLNISHDIYVGRPLVYELEPIEDGEADWRLDITPGIAACPPLINDYLNEENDFLDGLQADGVAAGFFCYQLDAVRGINDLDADLDENDCLCPSLRGRIQYFAASYSKSSACWLWRSPWSGSWTGCVPSI